MPVITTSNIIYSYDGKRTFSYPDIICDAGETLLVTGKSGCGKTTLLHILGGMLNRYKGTILINGVNISAFINGQLDAFRGKNIGIVFQHSHFIKSLSVRDNILIASKNNKYTNLQQLAEKLQIKHLLSKPPATLSQGEQQRAAIARALINKPSLLLADEPTSSLDDGNAAAVLDLLQAQSAALGSALIIVTHDERLKQKIANGITLS